jgi:uncharacterized protein
MQRFEWDERKNESNLRKHGISFETAKLVFDDPNFLLYRDRVLETEERWHAIGTVPGPVLVVVVHTYRDRNTEIIRIISARRATKQEVRRYVEAL